MSIGAAIRIISPDEEKIIEHAAAYARARSMPCFVISVVDGLPYGSGAEERRDTVQRNLELISRHAASPVLQEGDDFARTLLDVARLFGVSMMFVHGWLAEKLLRLDPPFEVVVVGSE